ncbi:MAG TPA: glutaredoxin family protein [Burkholderiales bacterium]|nr:glutaredoxin family protein [Burkholderiales bacterium]
MRPSMFLIVLISLAALAQAETYKWVDAEGKVHYSDQPPPPDARKSERKQLGDKPAEVALPYVLQQAIKNFPVTLFVYDCGDGCTRARDFLVKRGVPHTSKDPTAPGMREELKKVTGGAEVVPVLQVGRRVLRGFAEDTWNAALDDAGYPKTALVQITPVQAKPASGAAQAAPEEAAPESGS